MLSITACNRCGPRHPPGRLTGRYPAAILQGTSVSHHRIASSPSPRRVGDFVAICEAHEPALEGRLGRLGSFGRLRGVGCAEKDSSRPCRPRAHGFADEPGTEAGIWARTETRAGSDTRVVAGSRARVLTGSGIPILAGIGVPGLACAGILAVAGAGILTVAGAGILALACAGILAVAGAGARALAVTQDGRRPNWIAAGPGCARSPVAARRRPRGPPPAGSADTASSAFPLVAAPRSIIARSVLWPRRHGRTLSGTSATRAAEHLRRSADGIPESSDNMTLLSNFAHHAAIHDLRSI